MTALWVAALLVSAAPVDSPNTKTTSSSSATAANSAATAPRSGSAATMPERTPVQWREAVSEAMKKTAGAKDAELDAAAELLIPLYQEIAADTKLPKADREPLRQRLRERLLTVRNDLVARIQKDQNAILAQKLPGTAVTNNTSAVVTDQGKQLVDAVKTVQPNTWVERGGNGSAVLFPGGANQPAGINGGAGGGILAQQFGVPGARPGGAGGPGGAAGGQLGPQKAADHGQELVDLIQSIIAPQTWDSAGGPGSIRYWAPGAALIITNTAEAHEELGDVLKQLRKN